MTDIRSDMTIADGIFQAEFALGAAEERLVMALDTVAGDTWDDFTTDWYDRSVEVYFLLVPSDPEAVAEKMFDAGFTVCWVHPHPSPRGDCRCPARARARARPQA